jgi:peptidoglycan/LPS O-acetylase OafA/YrhL
MAPSERTRRAAGLDGLRALAALSVLCFHAWLYGFPDPSGVARNSLFDRVMFEMYLGLMFFFVLSGYLLYRAFARAALTADGRVDVRRYARRRVARIVPAYWVATLGAIALLWGARGSPGVRLPDASDLPLFAVFGQNYSLSTIVRLNPVTWTLCVEAAFYVLLPLIGWMAWRIGPRARARQAVLVGALIPLGLVWNAIVHDQAWNILATKALPAYLPYFAFGMLLALWAESRTERAARAAAAPGPSGRGPAPLGPRATAALMIAGFSLVVADAYWHATAAPRVVNPLSAIVADLPAGLGFALVVGAVVAGRGVATGWVATRPLAWVGLVSYGVYMWHVPLILFARSIGALPSFYPLRLVVILGPVLLAAAASWYAVERPAVAWAARDRPARRRSRAERRRQAQLEAQAAP